MAFICVVTTQKTLKRNNNNNARDDTEVGERASSAAPTQSKTKGMKHNNV